MASWKISGVTALHLKKGKATGNTSQELLVNELFYLQPVTKTAIKGLLKVKD